MEGIFQWELEGIFRLIENNFQFTNSDSNDNLLAEYRKQSNNVVWFVEEHCELIPETFEYSRQLYQHYKQMILKMDCNLSRRLNLINLLKTVILNNY